MVVNRRESSGTTTSSWLQCPVCRQVRLTSERVSSDAAIAFNLIEQAEDDIAYQAENDNQTSVAYQFT